VTPIKTTGPPFSGGSTFPPSPLEPEVPLVPDVPDVPLVPLVPLVPDVPEVPLVPLVPGVPDAPDVPGVPPEVPSLTFASSEPLHAGTAARIAPSPATAPIKRPCRITKLLRSPL
jgi:hypothetical protein